MVSEMASYVIVLINIGTLVWCRGPSVRNSTPNPPIPSEAEVAEVAEVVVRVSASCAILSGAAHNLPGHVVTRVGNAPREEGKTVQPERQDAPDEEEAEHEREADDVRDKAREIAGVDATIKSVDAEIECDVGVEAENIAPFLLLDLCGKIFATSPKSVESCDLCPAAPMLSHSAARSLQDIGFGGSWLRPV